jgi:GTP cyclohydrolase II
MNAASHYAISQPDSESDSESESVPTATVRASVTVPFHFLDGYQTVGQLFSFSGLVDPKEHVAIGLGAYEKLEHEAGQPTLVRIHSECLTGDVFGSTRCDCGAQLREAMSEISLSGGYLLYLRQEGRGIGLYDKIDAYRLQDEGLDTFAANRALGRGNDERSYMVAAQMLLALGVQRVRLLSNNPDKAEQLVEFGIEVVEQVPTGVHVTEDNLEYLSTKAVLGAHTIEIPEDRSES